MSEDNRNLEKIIPTENSLQGIVEKEPEAKKEPVKHGVLYNVFYGVPQKVLQYADDLVEGLSTMIIGE